ncbi:MAG: glucose-1-phosphate adenylyltransferase [Eubacteriales bacterium]|nr:glucose-1-phosphate adenylyltransferase [Eubacteriales bacterium]
MAHQDVVALILAGGQGSRLGVLTEFLAKPAVPFGSRYRIIDFPLSNCSNSGIEAVGVLTQYQPLELNSYIGNGHSWDLDRNDGGTYILPPYVSQEGSDWYLGTANAIYQNIPFIDSFSPKHVLILSGDHVYKMDYSQMVRTHTEVGADASIAVIEVPWEETDRFGIMNTDENKRINEFDEKPAHAKSNLASMGVYCFNWSSLRRCLIEDEADPDSKNDFGHNIIPRMLDEGLFLYAYTFEGYWKDVGTVKSLWDTNMDVLDTPEVLDLHDQSWIIYSKNPQRPSHYFGPKAVAERIAISDGAEVHGEVRHSVISVGAKVEVDAVVEDSIIMPGAIVKSGAVLRKCIVGMNTVIGSDVLIAPEISDENDFVNNRLCEAGISVIAQDLVIHDGAQISGNSMIGPGDAVTHPHIVSEMPTRYSY